MENKLVVKTKKIVIISLYGCWPDFILLDKRIINHLNQHNFEVDVITCEGELTSCDQTISYRETYGVDKKQVCEMCNSNTKIFSGEKNKYKINNHHKMMKEQRGESPREFLNKIGFNVVSLCNQHKISNNHYIHNIKNIREQSRDFIELTDAAMIVDSWFADFLKNKKYDCAIMTHPHRSLMNVFTTQLKKETIPILGYVDAGPADQKSFVMYSEKESLIPIQGSERPEYSARYPIYKIQGDGEHDIRRTISYMYKAISGKSAGKTTNIEWRYQQKVRPETNIETENTSIIQKVSKKYKKTVCLFTNTESENQATTTLHEFDVQYKCRQTMIKIAKKQKETLFIIREHPNRYISKASTSAEKSYWYDNIMLEEHMGEKCINNLLIIHSWDTIDATDIIKLSDLCICPISSLALDTCLASKLLITGPYSQYSNIATEVLPVADRTNEGEYEETISRVLKSIEKDIQNKLDAVEAGKINKLWPKQYELIDNSLHALPFYKIDRVDLNIKGSEYTLSEVIKDFIEKKGEQTFTETITDKLVPNSKSESTKIISRKEMQLTGDFNLCNRLVILLNKRRKAIECFRMKEQNVDSESYNLRYWKKNKKTLDLSDKKISITLLGLKYEIMNDEKNKNLILTDIAILDKDGLIRKGWEPSYSFESLVTKLELMVGIHKEEIGMILESVVQLRSRYRQQKYHTEYTRISTIEDIKKYLDEGVIEYIGRPLATIISNEKSG